jgi:hypothetical protein
MEYLARVRDGSQGTLTNGYWTCSAIGAEPEEKALTPLYNCLYSQANPDFKSENAEIRKAISFVSEHTEKRGIWVLDRGGDRRKIIHHLVGNKLRFIIRLKVDRHLVYLGIKTKLKVLARHVLKAARRLFGIPDIRFYALADGIRDLLFGRKKGLEGVSQILKTESIQLCLFDP